MTTSFPQTTSRPVCNMQTDGKQYYTQNALDNFGENVGGGIGMFLNGSCCFVMTIILVISVSANGPKNAVSIIVFIFLLSSLYGLYKSQKQAVKLPDDATTDCVQTKFGLS